jgi:hypothetical protein
MSFVAVSVAPILLVFLVRSGPMSARNTVQTFLLIIPSPPAYPSCHQSEKSGGRIVKKKSPVLACVLFLISAAFALAKDPLDLKNPKSLEGKTWTVTGWDVSTKQGPLRFELSLVIDKVTGKGKRTTAKGLYISQETNQRKPDVSNFDSPVVETKEGLKFGFKTFQGENVEAELLRDGSCRISGPLGVATLKPAAP